MPILRSQVTLSLVVAQDRRTLGDGEIARALRGGEVWATVDRFPKGNYAGSARELLAP
jgi:hypothetical protein